MQPTFGASPFGQVFPVREVAPRMSQGDAIGNKMSVTAFRGQDLLVDDAASIGGVQASTRALANRFAKQGIRVNAVAPGPIRTPLTPAGCSEEKVEAVGKIAPLGRRCQRCEVAPAMLFPACGDALCMRGRTLCPNGREGLGS